MSRDPDVYANPTCLIPERYLGENPEPDPSLVAFGFGRRWVISPKYRREVLTIFTRM